jgi:hypothetical protein
MEIIACFLPRHNVHFGTFGSSAAIQGSATQNIAVTTARCFILYVTSHLSKSIDFDYRNVFAVDCQLSFLIAPGDSLSMN